MVGYEGAWSNVITVTWGWVSNLQKKVLCNTKETKKDSLEDLL